VEDHGELITDHVVSTVPVAKSVGSVVDHRVSLAVFLADEKDFWHDLAKAVHREQMVKALLRGANRCHVESRMIASALSRRMSRKFDVDAPLLSW